MRLVIVRRHHAVLAVERNKYVTDGRHGFDGQYPYQEYVAPTRLPDFRFQQSYVGFRRQRT
jgi:hypothetical protein